MVVHLRSHTMYGQHFLQLLVGHTVYGQDALESQLFLELGRYVIC